MQKNMKEKLSFVIPCYYSEKTIGDVLKRIIATVNEDGRYDYEIICVNDGSTDGTYAVLIYQEILDNILHLWRDFVMLQEISLSVWMTMDRTRRKKCLN